MTPVIRFFPETNPLHPFWIMDVDELKPVRTARDIGECVGNGHPAGTSDIQKADVL